ncbi:hypothetical protein BC826DRAFT_301234 [Russula brevipes]|nr:hypothetical protein BC826DRAFT_301234 [Russula brevipes]
MVRRSRMLWLRSAIRWLLGLCILCIGIGRSTWQCTMRRTPLQLNSTRVPELFLCFMPFLFVLSVGLWYKGKQLLPPFPHLRQIFFTHITFILIQ